MYRRNKYILDREIVAAGAAHPGGMPSVEDFAIGRRKEQDADNRRAVRQQARAVAIDDPAAGLQPPSMLAAAGERPPAGGAIAAVDADRLAQRRPGPGDRNVRIAAENLARALARQIAARQTAIAVHRQAPAGRTVNARDRLDDPQRSCRIDFGTTQRARPPQAKQPRLGHRLDQRQRQPSRPLVLLRCRFDLRRQRRYGVEKLGCRHHSHDALPKFYAARTILTDILPIPVRSATDMPLAPGSCIPADTIRTLPSYRRITATTRSRCRVPACGQRSSERPGQHLSGLNLEDTS